MDEGIKKYTMSFDQKNILGLNNNISKNVNLSNYSWFNLGGPAEYLFKPNNKNQLIEFLKKNKKDKLKLTVLGAGSNTLIRDNGVKGVVIKLGSGFSEVKLIDLNQRKILLKDNSVFNYEKLISSIPITEICKMIKDVPLDVINASKKLKFSSGFIISVGFNKKDIPKHL